MAYCTQKNLEDTFGEENIQGWSRHDPVTIARAIKSAQAEIDGYLFSGGYTVPLDPVPENIANYCIDLAAAKLLTGVGVNIEDPGEKVILDSASNARGYLKKVAEGKYRIPGYSQEGDKAKPPAGSVQVKADKKFDWRGY